MMNEHIKELVEQAKEVSYWLDGGYTPVYRINLEKLAELIIKECARVAGRDVGHFVLERFGVEE